MIILVLVGLVLAGVQSVIYRVSNRRKGGVVQEV